MTCLAFVLHVTSLGSQDKAHADKVTLQAEFDEMRRATNDSITSASTATLVKEEMEAKLRNLMDGATVKEKELEVALFNSVHECAQVTGLCMQGGTRGQSREYALSGGSANDRVWGGCT